MRKVAHTEGLLRELAPQVLGVAHKFVNSGTGRLRQVDVHASDRFVTEWLED